MTSCRILVGVILHIPLLCDKYKVIGGRVPFNERRVKCLQPESCWHVALIWDMVLAGREGGKEPASYTKLHPSRDRHTKGAERQAVRSTVIK